MVINIAVALCTADHTSQVARVFDRRQNSAYQIVVYIFISQYNLLCVSISRPHSPIANNPKNFLIR